MDARRGSALRPRPADLKGGTSLGKWRLGNSGRFSTDLDFTAPNDDDVLAACEVMNGAVIAGFTFVLYEESNDAPTGDSA